MKTLGTQCIGFTHAQLEESEPIFELLFEALDDYRFNKRKEDKNATLRNLQDNSSRR